MPPAAAPTICLCMMVKNESRVIQRALASVYDLVDYWVICDTGSTDGTPALVLQAMLGVPGELHRTEWVSFGHNRTEVLGLARGKADYSLLLDADMVAYLHAGPDELKSRLSADFYEIRYEGDLDYSQIMLVSNRHEWRMVGVTHEYIASPTARSGEHLPELTLAHYGDGGMRADKFERDVRLLLEAHAADPRDERTLFYLAQSYRDLGDHAAALTWYERRIAHGGGWSEETFQALLQAGRMHCLLGHDWNQVEAALLAAWMYRPTRLEPLYELAHACRLREDWARGYLYSRMAQDPLPYPQDRLFIDRPVYTWKLALEHGVCAFGIGQVSEAVRVFNRVLDTPGRPHWAADAAIRGIHMSLEHLAPPRTAPRRGGNRIKVIVLFRNPGHFLDNCVESLLAQDHQRLEMIFVDDASSDGSHRRVPVEDPRVTLLRNPRRLGPACNLHRVLTRHCRPDDIAVYVDGDDWLACPDALSSIDALYQETGCWVTYGQYETSDGEYGICRPIPGPAEFARLRESWVASHLRTHRAGLFHRIAEQDPGYACLKDASGAWLQCTYDAALMFPLMELAGYSRVRYCGRILYVYNTGNPQSVHRDRESEQTRTHREIQRKQRFAAVGSYRPAPAAVLQEGAVA